MYERLTYWNEEYGCWSYRCASGDAAKMLAAYEDTGLTPKQIEGMKVIIKQYDQDRIAAQQECGSICEDAIKMHQQIQAQQQEIEQFETRLADIEISADRLSRDIYESDKVHIYISEIKARCGKFGANTTKILLDRLKALTAEKNKQTELLKQAKEALEYCILSGCRPAQGVAESVISSIIEQIGGTEG